MTSAYNELHFKYTRQKDVWDVLYVSAMINDLPLNVLRCGSSRYRGDHSIHVTRRDAFCFELVTSGNILFRYEGNERVIQSGEVYIHRPGCSFTKGPAGYACKRYVVLSGTAIDSLLVNCKLDKCSCLKPFFPNRVNGLLRNITRLLRDRPSGYEFDASAHAYQFVLELARDVSKSRPPAVDRAVRYIEDNLRNRVSSRHIYRYAGLSRAQLNRVFREAMGTSPMAYLIGRRMERAKFLLSTTPMRICEVALAVGYEDPLYFSSQFKKHVGVSPKFYATSRLADDTA